ncbi:MAG: OmpA family protein [Candidatus Hydrogenedentes bacterium]|nr:OmpA family protein [Candidatus Hydrogenedentota bacterium]
MEMKKGHGEEHENDERWLITYADLITLLMVFFVVMYSMSRTDAEKFKALASGLSHVFGKPAMNAAGIGGQPISGNSILPNKADGDARKGSRNKGADGDTRTRRIKALKSDLDALMEKQGLSKLVNTKVDPKGPKLVMELSDSLLFDAGSADLTPAAVQLLKPVGEVLGARDYNIHVEGHTDNVPISGRFKNNFELSTSRAVNVIMSLTEAAQLPPDMFSASGYGEYRPVASNDTPEGRAKNRRVDFVIYDENALDAMLGSSSTSEDAEEGATPLDETHPASAPAADASAHGESPASPGENAEPLPANAHGESVPTEHATPPPSESSHGTEPAHTETTQAPALDATPHEEQTASHTLGSILALPRAKPAESH